MLWKLWTPAPEYKPSIPETVKLVLVLEKASNSHPQHLGLCHFYTHAMELSATPEKAFLITNTLHVCSANQGHLLHMPSHIDMWVGQCKEAVEVNKAVDGVKQRRMMSFINFIWLHDYQFNLWCLHDYQFNLWYEQP